MLFSYSFPSITKRQIGIESLNAINSSDNFWGQPLWNAHQLMRVGMPAAYMADFMSEIV